MVNTRLKFMARHDTATGAHNRHFIMEKLKRWLKRRRSVSVLLIDLDDLRLFNDSFGQAAGEALLQEVIDRCRGQLVDDDVFGHLGDDEFVLATRRFAKKADATVWAREVMRDLAPSFRFDGRLMRVTASAGLAQYPDDGADADAILATADRAMYRSKSSSGCALCVAYPQIHAWAADQEALRCDFRRGLEAGELELFYQPKVRLADRCVAGFEALIRWWHPKRGLLMPGQFLPAIEQHGLSLDLASYVIEAAMAQAVAWREADLSCGHIAVNIDNPAFLDPDLNGANLETLTSAKCVQGMLHFELTEHITLLQPAEGLRNTLERLRQRGFQIALDDFGTGFASLTHLRQLPFDVLKIDRSFVTQVHSKREESAIVLAMITLAHQLGKEVVAEGIETVAEHAWLREQGCDFGQGYHFARPMRAAQATSLLKGECKLGDAVLCSATAPSRWAAGRGVAQTAARARTTDCDVIQLTPPVRAQRA